MANEIQVSVGTSGLTIYALIRNSISQIWRTDTNVFENYNASNYTNYTIVMTEESTSGFYAGTFPSAIAPGIYSVVAKNQLSGSPVQTDPNAGSGDLQWAGTAILPLSNLATSGQVGSISPVRIARSQQILNFTFNLVSSSDHVTAFTSGICSGQVSRDGAAFGAFQSGTISEVGQGFYSVNITSGDITCQTGAFLFSSVGVSGGNSDPRRFSFITQKISGY